MSVKKVTMGLTDLDIKNTEQLKDHLQSRSRAAAVSAALAFAKSLVDNVHEGDELLIKTKDGKLQRVIAPGFTTSVKASTNPES